MPELNEEKSLPGILSGMPDYVERVVVADNGSTDGSAEVARAHGAEVVIEATVPPAWPGCGFSRLRGSLLKYSYSSTRTGVTIRTR
jgi:glycosyltransferase involved in cell wall biosynthesis